MLSVRKNLPWLFYGGACTFIRNNLFHEIEAQYCQKLEETLAAGYQVLENNGKATDAVIAAIRVMKQSPLFNAGNDALFTHEGRNEIGCCHYGP